jgi:hypothetical protein
MSCIRERREGAVNMAVFPSSTSDLIKRNLYTMKYKPTLDALNLETSPKTFTAWILSKYTLVIWVIPDTIHKSFLVWFVLGD